MAQEYSRGELSMGLRLLVLLGMTVLLLIPQALISLLVDDRSVVSEQATETVVAPWGRRQTVQGPMLAIPYQVRLGADRSKEIAQRIAFVQPDSLAISVLVQPEVRYRGIFPVALYRAKVHMGGLFTGLSHIEFPSNTVSIQWEDARLAHYINDLVGLKSVPRIRCNDTLVELSSGSFANLPSRYAPLSSLFPLKGLSQATFTYDYTLNGSGQIDFLPSGDITHVDLALEWGRPSFTGKFLPDQRLMSDTLTTAQWTILGVNSSLAKAWTYDEDKYFDEDNFDNPDERFGVKMLYGVSHYDKVGRSVRFGVLMIVFTFLTFFFTDSLLRRLIPMIGYVLTGLAIMLFYTLLLSLSEYMSFGLAYLLAGGSVTIMISLYLYGFVRQWRPACLCGGILVILYTFLYIILQMDNFPLLVGSIFLFLVLGVVMYLSQRLDW